MQNEFEKKVQESLAGLSIEPADSVWASVERRIANRRRRRFAWWTVLAAFVILPAGLWVWHAGNQTAVVADKATPAYQQPAGHPAQAEQQRQPAASNNSGQKGSGSKKSVATGATANNSNHKPATTAHSTTASVQTPGSQSTPLQKNHRSNTKVPTRQAGDAANANIQAPQANVQSVGKPRPAPATQQAAMAAKETNDKKGWPETGVQGNAPVAVHEPTPGEQAIAGGRPEDAVAIVQPSNLDEKSMVAGKPDTLLTTVTQPGKGANNSNGPAIPRPAGTKVVHPGRRLAWLVQVSAGWADNLRSLPVLGQAKAESDARSPVNSSTGGSNAAPVNMQPDYRIGPGFGAGVSAAWRLSQQFSVTGGVQYQQMAARSYTGGRVQANRNVFDTAGGQRLQLDSYFSPAGGQFNTISNNRVSYTNRYHLLQLPLAVQWTPAGTAGVTSLQLGLAPSLLAGSNALYYDRFNNITYRNNDQFNRFQLNGNIGAMFTLGAKRAIALGPQLQYGIINLTKSRFNTSQHLAFAGVQVAYRLGN